MSEMKVIDRCMFCDTPVAVESDGTRMVFAAHGDSFCKGAMLGKIRALEGALKSVIDNSAQRCIDFGRSAGWREAIEKVNE